MNAVYNSTKNILYSESTTIEEKELGDFCGPEYKCDLKCAYHFIDGKEYKQGIDFVLKDPGVGKGLMGIGVEMVAFLPTGADHRYDDRTWEEFMEIWTNAPSIYSALHRARARFNLTHKL